MTPAEERASVQRLEQAAAVCLALAVALVPCAWVFWLAAAIAPGPNPSLRDTGWVLILGAVLLAGFTFLLLFVAWNDMEHDEEPEEPVEEASTWIDYPADDPHAWEVLEGVVIEPPSHHNAQPRFHDSSTCEVCKALGLNLGRW